MKILYASDTHVHPAHLDRLLKAAAELRPGAVVIGGDINPDWKGSIRASIEPHRQWVQRKLLPRLGRFREEYPGIPVLLDLGNDDLAAARPLLEEREGTDLFLLHMRVVKLDEKLAAAGYMKVNPTPFRIKDHEKPDCRDRDGLFDPGVVRAGSVTASGVEAPHVLSLADGTIEDDLNALSEVLESDEWKGFAFLFVSHDPPKDTALDRTGAGINVGSLAVRRFIEGWSARGRLVAALHGHIHESPWKSGRAWQYIGEVPCFNVGQQPHALRALILDTEAVPESARLVLVGASGEVLVAEKEEWV